MYQMRCDTTEYIQFVTLQFVTLQFVTLQFVTLQFVTQTIRDMIIDLRIDIIQLLYRGNQVR